MGKVFLLADDDADDRTLFCQALKEINPSIQCKTFIDGKETLTYLKNNIHNLPDIIFIDLNMPIMNGWECLDELRKYKELKNIPVIIYSTSSHSRDIERARVSGAIAYCTKPNYFDDIVKLLRSIANNLDGEIFEALRNNNVEKCFVFDK